ncbi:MAG: helix-turn-helix domain-containing protein [Lachnospiraceae bacterium]|nr:helix-turn-helix domain-containing protein [Lachnospiraceae bacterium]
MVNVKRLKGKIVECGLSVEKVADIVGVDKATLYRKMGAGGETFTIKEANSIAKALGLSSDELNAIFFDHEVA